MDRFWGFFIEKRSFAYLIIVALILFGLFSLFTIPKESTPEVRVPVGIVTTILPGASPEDVERLITNEIEDQLQGNLTNLKTLTSVSGDGISMVTAEFTADADLDKSIQELRDEVDKARPNLPEEAEDPVVSEVNFVDQPVVTFAISGDLDARAFSQLSEELEGEIESVPGVSRLSISGLREHEAHVTVRRAALTQYGISLQDVVSALRIGNASLPIGDISVDGVDYSIRFDGDIESVEELYAIHVPRASGSPIFLRDIATIDDTFGEESSRSRVSIDGKPSQPGITFQVFKRSGGDITAVTDAVVERLEELKQPGRLLEGLNTLVIFDSGDELRHELTELARVGIEAVLLVMITLFLTLGWREALIAGSSIPLSVVVAFIGLNYSGNTLNFVSLFSLILAVGILVDTGIVVVESIHTKVTSGDTAHVAAQKTLREFSWPLIAGTFTTIAVFAPLFLVSGITGQFIANIPFTIITILIASIFVSLGLLPVIASTFLKQHAENALERQQEGYTHKVQEWYEQRIRKILGNRKLENRIMLAMVLALFVALLLPVFGIVKVEFFPQEDVDFIIVEMEKPQGTVLADTDLDVRRVEEVLYGDASIASFTTTVGQSSPFTGGGGANTKSANVFINLREDRDVTSTQISETLREQLNEIKTSEVRVSQPNNGPPTGDPVVITFSGEDPDALESAVNSGESLLKSIPGAVDVTTSVENASTQFVFSVDRTRAAQAGVSPLLIAQTLRTAIEGTEATTIKTPREDLDVVVSLDLQSKGARTQNEIPFSAIEQIEVPSPHGTVLLGSLINYELSRSNASIEHKDGKRIATVSSQVGLGANAREIIGTFLERTPELQLPQGITYSVGGENEDAQEAFQDMFLALILGLILMLAILVVQFNSFRHSLYLLSIVPLSIIGVFLGLLISGKPISFPSLMGFIALAGVIVNHVIILTDLILHVRRAKPNAPIEDVVVEASRRRLRPIVLTTITTILGLIPLIFVSELWGPLAIAIIFGLSFAVTITLILIPIIYRRWPGKVHA